MRRMYGDQRHISVLRAEIESNDVEYLSEWKFREDVRKRYTTTTPDSTTSSAEHATSPYFRPASTTGFTPKLIPTPKSQQMEPGYAENPNPVTTEVDNNNNTITSKIYESTLNTVTFNAPASTIMQTTTEPATVNLSTVSNIVPSEKTVNITTTTPCTVTEQTETSTAEPPLATTVELTSERTAAATPHTETSFESQLFQDSKQQQATSSSQATPTAIVKLRGV
jgi:hypothetical protein